MYKRSGIVGLGSRWVYYSTNARKASTFNPGYRPFLIAHRIKTPHLGTTAPVWLLSAVGYICGNPRLSHRPPTAVTTHPLQISPAPGTTLLRTWRYISRTQHVTCWGSSSTLKVFSYSIPNARLSSTMQIFGYSLTNACVTWPVRKNGWRETAARKWFGPSARSHKALISTSPLPNTPLTRHIQPLGVGLDDAVAGPGAAAAVDAVGVDRVCGSRGDSRS